MYKAKCPACNEINNLTDADLGITLKCGSCGEPFRFGDDIVAERKRVAAEKKRLEREEKARIDEMNREAAKRVKEAADAERARAAAEIQAKAREEEEHARFMQYAPTSAPRQSPGPVGIEGRLAASVLNVIGVLAFFIGVVFGFFAIYHATEGNTNYAWSLLTMTVSVCISGVMFLAMAAALKLLIAIERNTAPK